MIYAVKCSDYPFAYCVRVKAWRGDGQKTLCFSLLRVGIALFGELLPDLQSFGDSAYNHKGTLAFALASLPRKRVK